MPNLESSFRPPPILGNGHLQTILPALLPRMHHVRFTHERLELGDGDFLDLAWTRSGRSRLGIITHGLEGNTLAGYIRGMAEALAKSGWDALAWNLRGCGPEPNRLARSYHSGETGDLRAVIDRAAADYAEIALIGFSLGGNVTLKYLGESTPHSAIKVGAAVSTPVDLASSARVLDQHRGNRIYLRRFLTTMIAKMEAKARRFPDEAVFRQSRRVRSLREFDEYYTAPLNGFRDAADYWERCSARTFLPQISLPTLLLNARNDPFLAQPSFPVAEAADSRWLALEAPDSGGHVGFLDFADGVRPWSERRVMEFLNAAPPRKPQPYL